MTIWLVFIAGISLIIFFGHGAGSSKAEAEEEWTPRTYYIPVQYTSKDGRVMCYQTDNRNLSCLPTWMLDSPNSWLISYGKKKETKK